jgi:hypothetical protein
MSVTLLKVSHHLLLEMIVASVIILARG